MRKLLLATAAVLSFLPTAAFSQSQCFPSLCVTSNGGSGSSGSLSGNNDWTGNNSFLDTKLTIKNTSDTTKAFQFLASGITAGQTRIYTMPDFNATLATLAGTESLSNKTLPSFELGSAATDTTVTRASAGIMAVEGINLVNLSTAQELSNKTAVTLEMGTGATDTTLSRLGAGSLGVEGVAVPTVSSTDSLSNKTIPSFELGSAATDTTITRSAAGRLAVEGIDADLISATQNLSNKTFTSPPLAATSIDIGAAATPFRDLYLYGSGTFGTTSYKLTGTPTAARTITFPDTDLNFNPAGSLWAFEDFLNNNVTSLSIGQYGLSFGAVATGTISASQSAVFLTGGVSLLSHATNDNSGIDLVFGNSQTWRAIASNTIWAQSNWELEAVIQPGTSGAITNTAMFFGLANSGGIDLIKAGAALIGIRRDTDLSDGTWFFVSCNSATNGCASAGDDTNQKVIASTITPTAGTNTRLRIRRAASGVGGLPTIYMSVNNETELTFCSSGCTDLDSTLPTASTVIFPVFMFLTRTTTGVQSSDIDYFSVHIVNLPARF